MRVPVMATLDLEGAAQFVAAIDNADDFCIDEQNAGFAYITRHRANTFDRVPLDRATAAKSATSPVTRSTKPSSAIQRRVGTRRSATTGASLTSPQTVAPSLRQKASPAGPHYFGPNSHTRPGLPGYDSADK